MNFIAKLFDALKAEKELENPATWKSKQMLGNALLPVLLFIAIFIPHKYGVTQTDIENTVFVIVSIASFFNMVLTKVTTKKAIPWFDKGAQPDGSIKLATGTAISQGAGGLTSTSAADDGFEQDLATSTLPPVVSNSDPVAMPPDGRAMQDKAADALRGR